MYIGRLYGAIAAAGRGVKILRGVYARSTHVCLKRRRLKREAMLARAPGARTRFFPLAGREWRRARDAKAHGALRQAPSRQS
jgi:hypothetical protein